MLAHLIRVVFFEVADQVESSEVLEQDEDERAISRLLLEVLPEGEGTPLLSGLTDLSCATSKAFSRASGESFRLITLIRGTRFGVVERLAESTGVVGRKLVTLILVILVGEAERLTEPVGGLPRELTTLILVIREGVAEATAGGDGERERGFTRTMTFGGEGSVGVPDRELSGVDQPSGILILMTRMLVKLATLGDRSGVGILNSRSARASLEEPSGFWRACSANISLYWRARLVGGAVY